MLPRLAEGRSVDLNWDVLGMRATRSDSLILDLDHVGPLTRSVSDNALMIEVIAGHDPLDPGSAAAPAGHYASGLERGVRGLRIGFIRHFHDTGMPADPEVGAALERVVQTLQKLGAEIRDVSLPTLEEFAAVNRVIPAERSLGDSRQVAVGATRRLRPTGPAPGSWRARSWTPAIMCRRRAGG
jgi:Asp-tRNA(Asn)/Glu-tRNA(Gln) amidotransferase A subunit family amidase